MIWWVVFLFAAGLALILAEFFLPGAILGITGGVFVILSAGLGMYFYPDQAILLLVAEILGGGLALLGGVFLVSKTGVGSGLMLSTRQDVEQGYVNVPTDKGLLGKTGSVLTPLRPAGTIIVEEERIDAVADGTFIPADAQVRVIDVQGNRVVVEQINAPGAN